MFFEMRFDLGTLDSGERSLPFGLLVLFFPQSENLIRMYSQILKAQAVSQSRQ